ncbi:MAG: hypothetical protein ACOYOK_12740 [Pseudobdellovibrionaceae bacterium]
MESVKPSSTPSARFTTGVQVRRLAPTQVVTDLPVLTTRDGAKSLDSELVHFSCWTESSQTLQNQWNGLMLVADSTLYFRRSPDQQVSIQGTRTDAARSLSAQVVLQCFQNSAVAGSPTANLQNGISGLDLQQIEIKALRDGDKSTEFIYIAPVAKEAAKFREGSEVLSKPADFYCVDNVMASKQRSGLFLLKGSVVVVARDLTASTFAAGSESAKPYALISCQ